MPAGDPRITGVRALPLKGATPDGGWSQGFDEEENLHTLIEVSIRAISQPICIQRYEFPQHVQLAS